LRKAKRHFTTTEQALTEAGLEPLKRNNITVNKTGKQEPGEKFSTKQASNNISGRRDPPKKQKQKQK
jgi:hypothetical protein